MLNEFLVLGQIPGTNIYLNFYEIAGFGLLFALWLLARRYGGIRKAYRLGLASASKLVRQRYNHLPVQLKLFK